LELLDGGVDAGAGEVVDLQALDDLVRPVLDGHREGGDEALRHAVGTVRRDAHGGPVALGRAVDPGVDVVDGGVGGGGGRRGAPRLATVGMKSSASHFSSLTTSAAFLPATVAWKMSGYWVAEWLPQIVSFLISETGTPVFFDSWVSARLWSRRVIAVNRSAGTSGAAAWAMSALVLAGLPTTSTRMSSAAWALMAWPCGLKMPPLASRRSPRSMPLVRGRA